MQNFYSQNTSSLPIQQDKFVCESLKYKKDGTFLDIGCGSYQYINNTYYLEKELNWSGIGIDFDGSHKEGWDNHRKASFILADATALDYQQLLEKHNMPKIIDYLSVDLEPPTLTLKALLKVFEASFSFNIVTFETDFYREKSTRGPSRKFLEEKGYVLVLGSEQDDYYIHSRILA
jgi:hypothetical protein